MATDYDIAFLRVAMRNNVTVEKTSAMRCLDIIKEQGAQGRTVNAMQVAVHMGLLREDEAQQVDAQTRHEMQRSSSSGWLTAETATGRFNKEALAAHPPVPVAAPPGPPPPMPGSGSASAVSRAAADDWYDLAENGVGLDPYELGKKMGRGPVGASYRGRRKEDGAPLAVKVVTRRFQQHAELFAAVLEDLRSWEGIEHQRLSHIQALGKSNDRDVVVYDFADGVPLDQHLREHGPLPPSKALRVIYEVGLALATGEARQAFHGDVRAEKVYWDGKHATLVDPGMGRASALAQGFGQFGLPFGHPAYAAPEILQERLERPTAQTDVYALGILFYQLVCGQRPYTGEPREMLHQHFEAKLPPPPNGIEFSTTIAALMLKMTAKSPQQRIQGPTQLVEAITRLLQGKPLFPQPAAPLSPDDWGRVSHQEEHAGHAQDWTASRIERAPAVGPSGLGEFDAHATNDTARLPRITDVGEANQEDMTLGAKLGRGTVGTAYEGTLGGAPVVLKVVSRKYNRHGDLLRRIMKSVGAAAELNHPHIVRALKAFRGKDEREVIVYERVVGQTLRDVLQAGPLPASQATDIIFQLCDALATAGSRGVCHGDIRPEKVYISEQGAKLADFGLAEAACLGGGHGRYGMHFGHPNYLAPEVLQESLPSPTPQSDIYALGVLYYEMICGRPPFDDDDARAVLKRHLTQPLPPPPDEVTIPGAVAEVILRMTSKDPQRRLASPRAVRELLEPLRGLDASQEMSGITGSLGSAIAPPLGSGVARVASGIISGIRDASGELVEVEEFELDELDAPGEDTMSIDAWDAHSENLAKPSGEWDKAKIEHAPKIGPEEWTPQSDLGEGEGETLSQAIRQATIDKAMAMRKEGKVPGKRKASARVRTGGGGEGGSKLPLLLGVFLLVVVVGGVGAFVATRDDGTSTGSTDGVASGTGTDGASGTGSGDTGGADGGLKTTEAEALARLEREKQEKAKRERIAQGVAEYERLIGSMIDEGRFQDALDRELSLTDEVVGSAEGKAAIAAAKRKVKKRLQEKVREARGQVEAYLEKGDFDGARSVIMAVKGWLPSSQTQELSALTGLIESAEMARFRAVKRLKLSSGRVSPGAKTKLRSSLSGETDAVLFDEGGCYLSFADGATLGSDFVALQGSAGDRSRAPTGADSWRISASKQPALILLQAPLQQIVQVTLTLVVAEAGDDPRVSILLGARQRRLKSHGLAWGLTPVELRANGLLDVPAGPSQPIPTGEPLTITVELTGRNLGGKLQVGDKPPRTNAGKSFKGEATSLAIHVEDAVVHLISLEVGGLVDPEPLQ